MKKCELETLKVSEQGKGTLFEADPPGRPKSYSEGPLVSENQNKKDG